MSFKEQWQAAGQEDERFEPPAGTYMTRIVDGGAFTSRAGDDYAKVVLQILPDRRVDSELVGRRFEHFMGFKHPVGARINREALSLYGCAVEQVESVEGLDDAIRQLVDAGVLPEVSVAYKDNYLQVKPLGVRIPQATDVPATANDFAAAAAQADDDEIPFLWTGPIDFNDRYHSGRAF